MPPVEIDITRRVAIFETLPVKATQERASLARAQSFSRAQADADQPTWTLGACAPFRAAGEMLARHRSMGRARVSQPATEGKQSVPRTSVPRTRLARWVTGRTGLRQVGARKLLQVLLDSLGSRSSAEFRSMPVGYPPSNASYFAVLP